MMNRKRYECNSHKPVRPVSFLSFQNWVELCMLCKLDLSLCHVVLSLGAEPFIIHYNVPNLPFTDVS